MVGTGPESGYLSDPRILGGGGAKKDSGYISEGGAGEHYLGRGCGRGTMDGYTSEGGLEAYSRKMEQRLAYERQREEAETQHRKYLEVVWPEELYMFIEYHSHL